jgi:myo-inositol-1(or 4)-monophosphatase
MKTESVKASGNLPRQCASSRQQDLQRIQAALEAAGSLLLHFYLRGVTTEFKGNGDPVTIADRSVDRLLRETLPTDEEGWLSEESANDPGRLGKDRVWIVDPLDGTREFVAGIPEWSVSIGLVENGRAVAGGICNPATGEMVVGSLETGIVVRAGERKAFSRTEGQSPCVLASRSEIKRGEWNYFLEAPFTIRSIGSIAYKLALIAAGLAEATWTFVPKNEWDVAAGVALVMAGGGFATTLEGQVPVFNRRDPLLSGLIAISRVGRGRHADLLDRWLEGYKAASPPYHSD